MLSGLRETLIEADALLHAPVESESMGAPRGLLGTALFFIVAMLLPLLGLVVVENSFRFLGFGVIPSMLAIFAYGGITLIQVTRRGMRRRALASGSVVDQVDEFEDFVRDFAPLAAFGVMLYLVVPYGPYMFWANDWLALGAWTAGVGLLASSAGLHIHEGVSRWVRFSRVHRRLSELLQSSEGGLGSRLLDAAVAPSSQAGCAEDAVIPTQHGS